ncbi:MAG TPA: hypothetical protein D7I10_07625 [Candidatus Poseidoniales archaeon]|nr:MAG TPA: hypothetical protein D7I10_07625 [Candidatus Poseidoniales archaeon]HIH82280.1 hypothetical protein [Candidatus Thalassarchaeaceae archaeon]
MRPEQLRLALVVGMLLSAGLLLFNPIEPKMNTEVIFDDEAMMKIREGSTEDENYQLVLRIRHDEGGLLTNNLTRVQDLLQLETEFLDGSNPDTSWDSCIAENAEDCEYSSLNIDRVITPFGAWSDAFDSRNRSLPEATRWADVLQPEIEEGWCGNSANNAEKSAFEATLLMLPEGANFGIACPAFPGSSATQAPASNEILWLVYVGAGGQGGDWNELNIWADKVSENTDYDVSAAGVNMLYGKAKANAEAELVMVIIPSIFLLGLILTIGLRDWQVATATIGGVCLVIGAELGLLSLFDFEFSVLDGIALPIIMGVAVDGAYWYSRSSRNRDEVRSMLFVAMITTVAAVSLALFSPIRAQRSLGLVMAIGIILDWVMTRYLLEDFFLNRRKVHEDFSGVTSTANSSSAWAWPVALIILASIAVMAPPGVNVMDIEQFLPEDDPALVEMEELQSKYVLASSTLAWVVIDVDGGSEEDYLKLQNLQQQIGHHPSVISLETGMLRTPMVIGITAENATTVDQAVEEGDETLFLDGSLAQRLQHEGVTSGVAIAVFIDGQNSEAAIQFMDDLHLLMERNQMVGVVGGDLPTGALASKTFEESRIAQILSAGLVIFIVAYFALRNPKQAARIAVGSIAIGAAVDGMATLFGGRGVNTALAVLLGMGFAADYLSHASADHRPTRLDMSARWGAALSSVSVFFLLSLTTFPPAKNTGQLLTISILFSAILATCLALVHTGKNTQISEE